MEVRLMQTYYIPLSNDNEEITVHGTKEFPIAIYKTELSKNILGYTPLHWHNEMQFVLVIEGNACFNVNQTKHYIKEKQGIFINSSCLHSAVAYNSKDCIYISFDISPLFFATSENIIQKKYVQPFLNSKSISFIELDRSVAYQKQILDILHDLYVIYTNKDFAYELDMYYKIHNIWHLIVTSTPDYINEVNANFFVEDQRIKEMITFIHQNYKDKISLKDIAAIGNISPAECCRIFKRMIQLTPFEYLIAHRINQSIILLKKTNLNITEIAMEVGFGSVSYYIEKFRNQTSYTPKKFRYHSTVSNK
jgi:AraC-like DNA-binding protein